MADKRTMVLTSVSGFEDLTLEVTFDYSPDPWEEERPGYSGQLEIFSVEICWTDLCDADCDSIAEAVRSRLEQEAREE